VGVFLDDCFQQLAAIDWLRQQIGDRMRIPGHADHDSGLMAIAIAGSCRS